MTTVIRQWPDTLFYIPTTGSGNALDSLQKIALSTKRDRTIHDAQTVDSNGDEQQDVLQGLSFGNLAQRHRYRLFYDHDNARILVQRNTGTDAAKVWGEILRLDASGNLTPAGSLSADALTATAGGLIVSGDIDANGYYIRNLDKNVGVFRTDSLVVHGSSQLSGAVNFNGVTTFYNRALKALAFKDQVSNVDVSTAAAIARSKIAASANANRLVYNASATGLLADLDALTASRVLRSDANGLPTANDALTASRVLQSDANGFPASLAAITASRALISDANGFPTHSTVTSTELALLSGITSIGGLGAPLASYTPSAVASVDITSVLSATWDLYLVVFSLAPATDAVTLRLRTDDANGASFDAGVSDYNDVLSAGGSSFIALGLDIGNGAFGCFGAFFFQTSNKQGYMLGGVSEDGSTGIPVSMVGTGGYRSGGSTINALQLSFSSGNISNGNVKIWGVGKP